jgi:hypothetical protein
MEKCNVDCNFNLDEKKCKVDCNFNLEVHKVQPSIVGNDLSDASDGTTVLYAFSGSSITTGTSP